MLAAAQTPPYTQVSCGTNTTQSHVPVLLGRLCLCTYQGENAANLQAEQNVMLAYEPPALIQTWM